jgi:hypothetical protein
MDDKELHMVKFIADETVKLLSYVRKDKVLTPEAISQFLFYLVENVATAVLKSTDNKDITEEEKYKIVSQSFSKLKLHVQEGVSTGFSRAMTNLTGKSVDYTCQISLMPETKNRLPC